MKNKRRYRVYLLIASIIVVLFSLILCNDYNDYYKETYSQIKDRKELIPLGNIIGISAKTDGVLVIGNEDEKKEIIGGIKPGDIIINIEGKRVNSAQEIYDILAEVKKNYIDVVIKRGDEYLQEKIDLIYEDGKNKLGLWVRDKISGIGTMTFYDADKQEFVAIGHPITDVDTKSIISIREGDIYRAENIKIIKGNQEKIGSIEAEFNIDKKIGGISSNEYCGISGTIDDFSKIESLKSYPIATFEEIEKGSAQILFQDNGGNIKKYDIIIEKIYNKNIDTNKNMVIEITDKELLDYTGGIVQGMSGAPIIQNNKIIGAITHVFIDNPKKGYGVFVEWMIK